jgi:uncharacterized protein (DUF2062 family)
MRRHFLKRIMPHPSTLQERWYLRVFGARIMDPRLWSLQRRSVTSAFAVGLAVCFVPLPVHLPLVALLAIALRLNVPTIIATVFLVNPLTAVPVYYTAYRVGALVLGLEPHRFRFKLDWQWLQYGLGPLWMPFLVGCLICALLAGALGGIALELAWRWRVRTRYRTRRAVSVS